MLYRSTADVGTAAAVYMVSLGSEEGSFIAEVGTAAAPPAVFAYYVINSGVYSRYKVRLALQQ